MKTNKILLGAFAVLAMGAMASCSNDEPDAIVGDNQEGDSYIAVRIVNPGNVGGRGLANGTPDFEVGIDKENAIKTDDIRFYFFNEQGQPFTLAAANVNGTVEYTNMVKPVEITPNLNPGNAATIANAVLVLGKPSQAYIGQTPSTVICVANIDDFASLAKKPLSAIENTIISNDSNQLPTSWTKFKMSSSVYAKGGDKVMATKIEPENICSTPALATANPVSIYIERIAVKVRTKGLGVYAAQQKGDKGELEDASFDFVNQDGDETTVTPTPLYVNLQGWRLVNRQATANLFKSIAADGNYFAGWNAPDYHRSYWENATATTETLQSKTIPLYDTDAVWFGNFDDKKPAENVAYCHPSTAWQPQGMTDRTANSTAFVIKAVVTTDEEGTAPANFVRWAGQYYELNVFKTVVLNAYKVQYPNTSVTLADITLEQQTGTNLYTAKVGQNLYARFTNIQWWKDGVTSYYVNIQHAAKTDGSALFGVVRNHIYQNEVTNVIGLGVPGDVRTEPVEEEESFVACMLTVLDWRVVSNQIVLE